MALRARSIVTAGVVVASLMSAGVARASATAFSPDPGLSASVDQSGTGGAVGTVKTAALRAAIPAHGSAPRILLIGTGVQRSLFPAGVQDSIVASGSDATDPYGYGTIAASTILQILPDAVITSRRVRPADANWFLADLSSLSSALQEARANASSYDLVLLAFPPQAALDPTTYMIGYGDYGTYGRGMAMVEEALLSTPVRNGVAGIPIDKALRDKIFARTDLRQRDAIERYARQAIAWRQILRDVTALDDAGLAVVAPSGDFTRKSNGTVVPLATQTVYGLSALPSVITVGAAYDDGSGWQVSPTSGRGPTLALGAKPDLLAPADVMSMLPAAAKLPWADDSARAPLHMLEWARDGVPPTACPSLSGDYRCVLQGSSMVSAAVVAANLAALASTGAVRAGAATDQVLRGIAWAGARAKARAGTRAADAWEQGAGVLAGLAGFDPRTAAIALKQADFGQVSPGAPGALSIPLWSGGAQPARAAATLTRFIGPDSSGAARTASYDATARLNATVSSGVVTLKAAAARAQGGIYTGSVAIGDTELPLWLTQDVAVDFHVDEAYNEFMSGGPEGERVEDASMVLFAGLPQNVGLVGDGFKNFATPQFDRFGGDPTNSVVIRAGTTRDSFTNASVAPADHGRGTIDAVPPGFYRFHVLTDHAMEATQARGRAESLGVFLATSGPEAASAPGANLLVPACSLGVLPGPLPCAQRDGSVQIDKSSGLCVASDSHAQVAFNVYCGEIAYATPSSFVSRAVHLVDYGEWSMCGVNVPLDGTALDFAAIAAKGRSCSGATTPTAWSFGAGAPDCASPAEGTSPKDLTATYSGPSVASAGRNLPVAVLTYDFALPYLNTYTTATATLQYAVQNAIVGARFSTGGTDASNSVLVADAAGVDVTPAVAASSPRGSASQQWAVMSSNAPSGSVSLILIPTAWARADLDPTKPISRVSLCDVSLRVSTFAKVAWGAPGSDASQFYPALDRGLLSQIDPSQSRMRAVWDGSAFRDAGRESESLVFASQVPKNSTRDASAARHVLSPVGGPAGLRAVRRWGTDALRHENVLASNARAYDPRRGAATLTCATTDPVQSNVCAAWTQARTSAATLGQLTPDLSLNGRFDGVVSADFATLKRAAGNVAFEIADADDGGASQSRWTTGAMPVSDYYDDAGQPWSLSALSGLVSVAKKGTSTILSLLTADPGGGAHTITAALS
jgi:hypothetical protein